MSTTTERPTWIAKIRDLPARIEAQVKDLSDKDLFTAFMEGEWTVAQNVHHLADAQMTYFIRTKLIVLEDHPTLKPFNQNDWAETPDSTRAAVLNSLAILQGVHARWALLLESLSDADWSRTGLHLELGEIDLSTMIAYGAEHGYVHERQINDTLAAKG